MYIERSRLKANSDYRAAARAQLTGNWTNAVLLMLFIYLIMAASAVTVVGPLLLTGPFLLGGSIFCIRLVKGENPLIETGFDGFKRFGPACLLHILIVVFCFLWSLLFIIPGIIAGLSYSMSFYVLNDNPDMTASEAMDRSKELMKGQKGKLFCLLLSFIGWAFLCAFTLGIGMLWLTPYVHVSMANFYIDVRDAHEQT